MAGLPGRFPFSLHGAECGGEGNAACHHDRLVRRHPTVRGANRSLGKIISAVSVALLLSGCTSSVVCAGQCRPPYELDVMFVAGTSIPTAEAVLQMCGHEPDVVRVALKSQNGRVLWGVVWTRHLGNARNEPLQTCLKSSPSVRSTGWPD